MSNVANVILATCGEADKAKELYRQFAEVDSMAGGNKCMECSVVMAAINYFDLEGFLKEFNAIEWMSPECVHLMIMGQDDDIFTSYFVD